MSAVYLWIYQDNPKIPVSDRLSVAVEAYERRWGTRAGVVLVNEADKDAVPPEGVSVRVAGNIRPNNYWVGVE